MGFHYNIFSYTLLISGVITFLLSLLIFQSGSRAIKWFGMMMLGSAIWAIAYSFELAAVGIDQMLVWINIEYIGITFIPATWIMFIILFTGKNSWLTWKTLATIFIFPIGCLALVWTNSYHHLHYRAVSIDTTGPFPLLDITPGPGYLVLTVYFYFMLVLGLFLLLRKFRSSDKLYREQNRTLLIGAFVPWVVNIAYLFGLRPFGHIDLTPYAFLITSIVVGMGLLRYQLFELIPLAREKIIESMSEGILVLDPEQRIIDLNKTMSRLITPQFSAQIGEYFRNILSEHRELRRLVRERKTEKIEITLPLKQSERHVEVAISPLYERKLKFAGTLLIFRDITQRRQAEDKLREQAQELADLNEIKDQLFSIIAHDLRSPLANLVSILNILDQGIITSEEFEKTFLPPLKKDVGHTASLLDNLLSWSRSQLQGARVNLKMFDLAELAADEMSRQEKKAAEKGIDIENIIPEGTQVYADPDMIQLVLRNLVSNAIKFCDPGARITLSTTSGTGFVTTCVEDTGIGIPPDTVENLFGHSHFTTRGTQNEKGTGLGLRLSKDFIIRNGGKIWVESELKKGSRFYFTLPQHPTETKDNPGPDLQDNPVPQSSAND